MAKNLVIVESPAKAKTINKYLGKDYIVIASMGHVRDLPRKAIGIDVEKNFEPTYTLLASRKRIITKLKAEAKKAEIVFLATDLDREGEAIAWHLTKALSLPANKIKRVVFNEITKRAIQEAFANPHEIDINKVDAQQTRRMLDRLVGYKLSPLLWRKISRARSAGRVQSVAVRLVVDREREIEAFDADEYWRIRAILSKTGDASAAKTAYDAFFAACEDPAKPDRKALAALFTEHGLFEAELRKLNSEKFAVSDEKAARSAEKAILAGDWTLAKVEQNKRKDRPSPPLITSTLQQTASSRLHFGARRTMQVAQQLYEGVEIAGEGSVGLITYMRTDSRHLAASAVAECRDLIGSEFGADYLPDKPQAYSSSAQAQEAHEAIRPTAAARTPEKMRGLLTNEQWKLYDLIWRRFVAGQMLPAVWLVTEATITAGPGEFKASGRVLQFDGHRKVSGFATKGDPILPDLKEGEILALTELKTTQHFTQPPPRYSEASLVRELEKRGIGRPSTYAAIISTIQDRHYVRGQDRRFFATNIGKVVTDQLVEHFPTILDYEFTRKLENELDQVEEGKFEYQKVLKDFYGPFAERLEAAKENMERVKAPPEESEYTCNLCGEPMVYRIGKHGRFLACTGFPNCKYTLNVSRKDEPLYGVYHEACPKCGLKMLIKPDRVDRKGDEDNPVTVAEAKRMACCTNDDCGHRMPAADPPEPAEGEAAKPATIETDEKCEKCGKPMVIRAGRFGPFMGCSGFPKCRTMKRLSKEEQAEARAKLPAKPKPKMTDVKCEECGKPMVIRNSRRGPFLGCSAFPKCRTTQPLPDELKAKSE